MILYLVAVIAVVIAIAILYAQWNYGTLESTGVPPKFILGSDLQHA